MADESGGTKQSFDWFLKPLLQTYGSVTSLKLGGGVIGRIAAIVIATVLGLAIAIAAVSYSSPTWAGVVGVSGVICILIISIYGLHSITQHSQKNPFTAMMEGGELLMHQQLQQGMKSQPILKIDPASLTTDPTQPILPQLDVKTVNQPDDPEQGSNPNLPPPASAQ